MIVHGIDQNWKVVLMFMVFLFFRPIRKFLVNLKKIGIGGSHAESGTHSGQKHDYGKNVA